jgi:hypothetical protein
MILICTPVRPLSSIVVHRPRPVISFSDPGISKYSVRGPQQPCASFLDLANPIRFVNIVGYHRANVHSPLSEKLIPSTPVIFVL